MGFDKKRYAHGF